jgi:hypothetical protein
LILVLWILGDLGVVGSGICQSSSLWLVPIHQLRARTETDPKLWRRKRGVRCKSMQISILRSMQTDVEATFMSMSASQQRQ